MPIKDPEKRRAVARAWYRANREKCIERSRRTQSVKRWRAKRKASGLAASGGVWRRLRENVNRAAERGKEYWPTGCRVDVKRPKRIKLVRPMRPWNDPSLSDAEKWKLRYRLDPDFHAREYQKALNRKRSRRRLIAESGLQPWRVALLRIQCNCCAYCEKQLPEVTDRIVDHVVPVAKGGLHEWNNLAIVCVQCNTKKAARMPTARQQAQAHRQRERLSGQLPLGV